MVKRYELNWPDQRMDEYSDGSYTDIAAEIATEALKELGEL